MNQDDKTNKDNETSLEASVQYHDKRLDKLEDKVDKVQETVSRIDQKTDDTAAYLKEHLEVDSKRLDYVEDWVLKKDAVKEANRERVKKWGTYITIVAGVVGITAALMEWLG